MSQFLDDLWDVVRFRFQTIEYYRYPLIFILLILGPYAFLGMVDTDFSPFPNWFVSPIYRYVCHYAQASAEIGLYAFIFSRILFDDGYRSNYKNVLSLLSLVYFIDALSLAFLVRTTTNFLGSCVIFFAASIMIWGLKVLSKKSLIKVILSFILASLLNLFVVSFIFFAALQLNWVDKDKYNEEIRNFIEELDLKGSVIMTTGK